ncbi:hypothetical protein [Collimonas sp. PA-H2]|uniref:hypothetical protein n=1 Tax=Collimonas sp. PA-H2 TaxID=1881062 RepID=UPI00118012F9|nr:hypothetical protein [Collimonas sp. PA-H2]
MSPFLTPPTDSRRKFLAIFGLTLIITAMVGFITTTSTLLDRKASYTEKIMVEEAVDGYESTTIGAKRLKLHRQMLDAVNKDLGATWFAAVAVLGIGVALSVRGFRGWKMEIEVREDRFAALQEAKLKAELRKFELEIVALEAVQRPSDLS